MLVFNAILECDAFDTEQHIAVCRAPTPYPLDPTRVKDIVHYSGRYYVVYEVSPFDLQMYLRIVADATNPVVDMLKVPNPVVNVDMSFPETPAVKASTDSMLFAVVPKRLEVANRAYIVEHGLITVYDGERREAYRGFVAWRTLRDKIEFMVYGERVDEEPQIPVERVQSPSIPPPPSLHIDVNIDKRSVKRFQGFIEKRVKEFEKSVKELFETLRRYGRRYRWDVSLIPSKTVHTSKLNDTGKPVIVALRSVYEIVVETGGRITPRLANTLREKGLLFIADETRREWSIEKVIACTWFGCVEDEYTPF